MPVVKLVVAKPRIFFVVFVTLLHRIIEGAFISSASAKLYPSKNGESAFTGGKSSPTSSCLQVGLHSTQREGCSLLLTRKH